MSRVLLIGSCRTLFPFVDDPVYVPYPSYVYSTSEIIQAIQIMKSELVVPSQFQKYVFRKGTEESVFDLTGGLSDVSSVIMEISSLKGYYHKDSGLFFHLGYKKHVRAGRLGYVGELSVVKETLEQVRVNLDVIEGMLVGMPLTIVCHNNLDMVPVRYELAATLSIWCSEHHHRFVDPTRLIAQYGIDRCMLSADPKHGFLHYTPFMEGMLVEYLKS